MNKTINNGLIIILNLVPVFGVALYNWQPFEAFWFFWLETLIIAFFNAIRIIFSQGQQATLNNQIPLVFHINKGIKYLLIRMGIFFFYAVFIIGFIGFIANPNKDKSMVLTTILFQDTFFNLGLLVSISSQGYYLITNFFTNRAYITTTPDNYAAIFDGRQVVLHVAIILGGLSSIFLMKNTSLGNYGSTVIISLLCICKCILEIFNSKSPALEIAAE